MSKLVTKRLFARVLVWQPATGAIIDLPSRSVEASGGFSREESRATMSDGSAEPTSRSHSLQIPISHEEARIASRLFRLTGCPARAALIGVEGTEHVLWHEEARVNIESPEASPGRSSKSLVLESSIFSPAIFRGMNLVEGVPWQATKARNVGSRIEMRYPGKGYRPGYEGPAYGVDSMGAEVDMLGVPAGLSEATVQFEFPAWGASLKLSAVAGYYLTGILKILDWNESVIAFADAGSALTIPERGWYVEVGLSDAGGRPRLDVVSPGVREGKFLTGHPREDCQRAPTEPPWEIVPEPNEPPGWVQKEPLVYGLNNTPPTLDCEDYTTTPDVTGGENSPPSWTNCPDYTVSEEETTSPEEEFVYTAPPVGPTSYIFTAGDGFSRFDYFPSESSYENYLDQDAAYDLAVDESAGYVFLATEGTIRRFDLSGGSATDVLSESGNDFAGIAVDPLTQRVYFSYLNQADIYRIAYDGSAKAQVTSDGGEAYALGVAPDGGDGAYLFGVSNKAEEVARWNIDGSGKTVLADYSNTLNYLQRNCHLHLEGSWVFYQQSDSSTERNIRRVSMNGGTDQGLFLEASSVRIADRQYWTVLQQEDKWIQVQSAEDGATSVQERNLDGSNPTSTTLSGTSYDLGERIASAQPVG
jgi:hypothetical protein